MRENSPDSGINWEKKLANAGMPGSLPRTKIPINEQTMGLVADKRESNEQSFLTEAMQPVLEDFSSLPDVIQDDIIADITTRQQAGMGFGEISKRLVLLVQKGAELANKPSEDSDKYYRPRPSHEQLKLDKETAKLLEELEKRRTPKLPVTDTENKRPDKTLKPAKEKPPETPKGWVQ